MALLVFPGLLYAVPMGWLMLGSERKLRARFQGRLGPPITQPFWDTVKLLAKWPASRVPADMRILSILPLLAVGSAVGALALLPVSPEKADSRAT
jgi:NADH-quinone oxidoreductase subunit H